MGGDKWVVVSGWWLVGGGKWVVISGWWKVGGGKWPCVTVTVPARLTES